MKITIISSNIYPVVSARSFRTTELAKGLAFLGHDVTVFAVLGSFDYTEFEKQFNVRVCNLGPCHILKSKGIVGFINKVMYKLRLPRLMFDYPFIEFQRLTRKVLERMEPCDLLITIAHPYGIHFGVAKYNKNIPQRKYQYWISDCGDPFMGDPDVKRFSFYLGRLEKMWGEQTDAISIPVENGRIGYAKEIQDKIHIIPQSIDFESVVTEVYNPNPVPTFLYCGAVYPGMRDPTQLLEYLCILNQDFRFVVYSSSKLFDAYKERLGEKLVIRERIPRLELIRIQSTMDFLVNLQNDSSVQTPSKLIDYALAKRPILDISTTLSDNDKRYLAEFLRGDYTHQHVVDNVDQYDNKNVANKFVQLYRNYINEKDK